MVDPVVSRTLQRVRRDTRPSTWRFWLILSVLLHLPITPLGSLLGWLGFLSWGQGSQDIEPAPELVEIPIDLMTDFSPSGATGTSAPAPASEPDAPGEPQPIATAKPKPKPKAEPLRDAGAPDASVDAALSDAGLPDAGKAEPGLADAGPPSTDAGATPDDAGAGRGLSDPLALAGAASKVTDPNANVKILVDTEKLRKNPLGGRVGALLAGVHQWRDFFGPTGVSPVRDIDRILIVGSQLRRSADVVAVIQHHLGRAKIRAAIDQLVKAQPDASWLDAGVPVASARADRADRFFVLPSAHLVVVTPPGARASAERVGARLRLPPLPGDVVAMAHVATPWRAVRGLPLRVPQSLRWARASVSSFQGGARIEIEAEDESEESARQHAPELQRALTAATQLDLGLLGNILGTKPTRFVERIEFTARDNHIHGELTLTAEQVATVLDWVEAFALPPPAAAGPGSQPRRSPTPPDAG